MLNPFRKIGDEEIKAKESAKKFIEEKIKTVAEIGRRILASADGLSYKVELEKQRDNIIKLMIATTDPDPIRDAFFVRMCLAKLAVVYNLLDSIKKDANAGR